MNWVRKYSELNGPKRSGRGKTPSSFPPLPPTYQRRAVAGEESSDLSQEKIRDLRRRATMLWVDKYRPRSLDKMLVHQDIAQNLKRLVLPRQRGIYSSSFFSFCLFDCFFFCLFVGWGFGAWWLSSSSLLRSVWVGQENPHNGRCQADVWCWSRKGSIFSA